MKLCNDEGGVSEVFGYLLIIGIVMTGLMIFVIAGSQAIQDTKESAQTTQAGQAFTVADSRLSKARFSTSIFQSTPFKLNDGVLSVNESDSYITIYDIDMATGARSLIYNQSLGTIKCTTSDGIIGYQDGGVWVKYNDNGSTMLSPPDFDYNGVTLTLPITRITGNGITAYKDSTAILDANSTGVPFIIFPGAKGSNPLPQKHTIEINITTEFAGAWLNYINGQTRANAMLAAPNKVCIRLDTGVGRQSGNPEEGFNTKSMNLENPTPIEVFIFNFYLKKPGNDYWINYDSGDINGKELTIYIGRAKGSINQEYASVRVTYRDGANVESFSGYLPQNRKSDTELSVNLLDMNQMPYIDSGVMYNVMIYDSSSPSTSWGTDRNSFDNGIVEGYINSSDVRTGDYKSSFDVFEHYLLLMADACSASGPNYIIPGHGSNEGTHGYEPQSNFILQFDSQQDIKYLYITEGTLNVNLGARS